MSPPIMTQRGQWPDRVAQIQADITHNREAQEPKLFGYWDSPRSRVHDSAG